MKSGVRRQSYCGGGLHERVYRPVVIVDGGRESSSTDSVAHDVDPFTEPRLNPKIQHKQNNRY